MIYFDNAATTKPCKEAISAFLEMTENFGNPSSLHEVGLQADKKLREAKEILAKELDCSYDEIIFTSGGTEANNLALQGMVRGERKLHFITSPSEHPAIKEPFIQLERQGHQVIKIPLREDGSFSMDTFLDLINEDTDMVSLIHVNNETGVVFDVEEIGQKIKGKNPNTIFHVDGVQGFLKHPISLKRGKIDLYTASAHKIHGFKGTGLLYVSKDIVLKPLCFGGEQEKELRPGTENILGAYAFAKTSEVFKTGEEEEIKKEFTRLLELEDVYINTKGNSPYIINMSFVGIPSEILVATLSSEGIYISAGAACSSKRPISLDYLGIDEKRAKSAVRFSFSYMNTVDEAKIVVDTLIKIVPRLRKLISI